MCSHGARKEKSTSTITKVQKHEYLLSWLQKEYAGLRVSECFPPTTSMIKKKIEARDVVECKAKEKRSYSEMNGQIGNAQNGTANAHQLLGESTLVDA